MAKELVYFFSKTIFLKVSMRQVVTQNLRYIRLIFRDKFISVVVRHNVSTYRHIYYEGITPNKIQLHKTFVLILRSPDIIC